MAKKLTNTEKSAHIMMKELIKKPTALKAKYFIPGNIILYTYKAKYEKNPYDASPILLVLKRNAKYTIGININWIPIPLRKGIMSILLNSSNMKRLRNGKDLIVPKTLVKQIFKMGLPAFRKYLNNRISSKGVVLPKEDYIKVINLRAEHFIGISADDAWKIAVNKLKKNKRGRK